MKIALSFERGTDEQVLERIVGIGKYLAYARPNEPLAQNGVL
jgi:hypothetical protein